MQQSRLFMILALLMAVHPLSLNAQRQGTISGEVVLGETGEVLHAATVLIVELGRTTLTDDFGRYRFDAVPPGSYQLLAHIDSALTEESQRVIVEAGETTTVYFSLGLAAQRQEITVTASGKHETAFESFQSVDSLDSFDLAESVAAAIGEVLASKPGNGVASRSFGPGNSRPIIRGFDGDRVLITQDGIRTGTLSSQSGDHGETVNTATLDRLEVVKGPATLLYGSNAMGGVVNAITRHHAVHEHPHEGLRGYVSGSGGSANAFGGGSAGIEFGKGKWLLWTGGSGQRTGDYSTPEGKVANSKSRLGSGYIGLGWYGNKTFISANVQLDDGLYGVPFAAELHSHDHEHELDGEVEEDHEEELDRVELDTRREAFQANWGLHNLGSAIEDFTLRTNFTRWQHDEMEVFEDGDRLVGTSFDNKQFVYRGVFEQAQRGNLTGRFGFWGLTRDYKAEGEEALSPPVDQNAWAIFGLEEVDFEKVKFQFGARLEQNRYNPGDFTGEIHDHEEEDHDHEEENDHEEDHDHAEEELHTYPKRTFTGASLAAGMHAGLWRNGALVVNYARSSRAPALEELYNNGPHVGNRAFEIGDENLTTETGNGVEVSLRQQGNRARGEMNLFYYDFNNFVFPFATGEEEHGLQVIKYTQTDSRFTGAEANLDLLLHRNVWLNLGMDFVDAQEKRTKTPLPRIPPLRGSVGFELDYQGLSVKPELIIANSQNQTFTGETRTPGYTVVNLIASYTIPRGHFVHQFSANVFNIGDRLYRNHSSFIKDLAPEIGRGIRFSYRLRFF